LFGRGSSTHLESVHYDIWILVRCKVKLTTGLKDAGSEKKQPAQ